MGLPSLLVYIVLAQDEAKIWVWTRGAAGFPAGPAVFDNADDVVAIEALGVEIPLNEVYARVKLA